VPGSRQPANLDDLWHAAVSGRGDFFFAKDTASVQNGLLGALTNLKARNAAGAAAATSTPNITPTDHGEFITTYISVDWTGELVEKLINPNTGVVDPTVVWSARGQLEDMTQATTDSRIIYMRDVTKTGGAMKSFFYANLTTTEKTWFDNLCSVAGTWSQCSTLDFGTGTLTSPAVNSPMWQANQGDNLVNFLRGRTQYRGTIYRNRPYALGDTVNATPLYIGKPRQAFADLVSLSYYDWKNQSNIAGRPAVVYVGANDGMLHAFNATTGAEMWAYIPRMVAPNMWKLADMNYGTKHTYYVDGSPSTMDVWDGSTWRTLLIGALNSGGRGYYALDVTDPNAPLALWEFCSDTTLTLCSVADANLGFSYGNPVITKRAYDGKWVVLVTSGYNNVDGSGAAKPDGHGHLYVLDALSGTVLDQTATPDAGNNNNTTGNPVPSGLAKIAVWAANAMVDNTGTAVYGGDLLGNVWKFDLTKSPPTVISLGQAKDAAGKPQPITSKPELALVQDTYRVVYVGTGRYVGNADLTDPATQTSPVPNPITAWMQSLYAFKDKDTDLGTLRNATGMVKQTLTSSSSTQRTVSSNAVDFSTQTGWYIDFNLSDSPGERVNIDPQLVLGTLIVTTNVPNTTACAVGGDAWVYQFDYLTGKVVPNVSGGIVGNKQTGALAVGMVVYQLQKGSIIGQLQRSDTQQVLQTINTGPGTSPHRRTSWRELTH
jgi:type IV pilus assembly protein PilY1